MKKQAVALLQLVILSVPTFAHEYWFEPDKFHLRPGEKTAVRLFLGEGLKKEEERPFQASKTTSFQLFARDQVFDFAQSAHDEDKPLVSFGADKEGNYLLSMERNWSYITLEADKFEDYLREDGMEYIIAERKKLGEGKKEGKERYSRFIKGLLQVGDKRDKTFAKNVGLKLEIVPLENPYSKKVGQTLAFQIFFNGRPLAVKTIFADNRDGEQISKVRMTTDRDGKISVKLDHKGVWLVRLVFMQRCAKNCEGADWESFWGALSFGIK